MPNTDGLDYDQGVTLTEKYIRHYNEERLHSAIAYVTPKDKLEGREEAIWKRRDEQLEKREYTEQRSARSSFGIPNCLKCSKKASR